MDKKLEFNEALSALIEYATVNGNQVTTDNVRDYFKDILDTEEMYEAVYKYLAESKIKIVDRDDVQVAVSTENEASASCSTGACIVDDLSEEEKMFLDMYMSDVRDLPELSDEDKALLVEKGCRGDRDAFGQLAEAYLPLVMSIADKYVGKGVKRNDLISDGNLGLMEAIMSYDFSGDFEAYVIECVERSMQYAIDEEVGMHRVAEHAADRANAISDATTELAEKLGREATIEELCEYMSLSEDEIRDIMKMSLDAMTITTTDEE